MRGWTAHAEKAFAVRTRAAANQARRSALSSTPRGVRVVVSLKLPEVAHDIVMRAVEPVPSACDVFRVFEDAAMNLRHPLGQTSHTLQLLFEE